MQRRSFLKQAGLGAIAGGATVAAPVVAQEMPALEWRMASSFPRHLETLFGTGERFCRYVSEASNGRFLIRPFSAGEIAPALQVFDAVSSHVVDCGHTVSYYYHDKDPAFCFDAAVPFGLTAAQMNAWMFDADGLSLTRAMFKPFGIVNLPMGNTGVQLGGWYRKEIKTVADFKGLRMGAAGLAGQVLARLGAVPQALAGDELLSALGSGALEAAESAGPTDDEAQGMHQMARYCYFPGWWTGGTQVSLYLNEGAWHGLPRAYQAIIEAASRSAHVAMTARYESRNPAALRRLVAEGAELRAFPRAVVDAAFAAAAQVYQGLSEQSPQFKALHESYMGFRDAALPWWRVGEGAYGQALSTVLANRRP
ncbi:ABC transporter substrate-binding protein [Bordetella trematum]|uniref:Solute binding protein n=1 Tax=Bordetella trematum TaxID=123899 RepID=A0A157QHQ3_9BORD|nr:twin-arginine translocation signal domain-containing protein [Bordetella trematum]AZR95444.1 ABC transporter substrate-binding protein [Bordetella trematum]NNH17780.1 twin-arginine translocation signal domain-containing protein [Bordetella trematum]SAI45080.1 solute binding protein [Bordetella trematum]SAI67350.1 solute binding protein [Bordetella trematum]SUV96180.1 solute binding protein [Bordetella trematum]